MRISITGTIVLFLFVVYSCNENNKQEKTMQSDTTKEINTADTFVIDKESVRKAFLEYLPTVSGGRQLNSSWETPDGKGYRIVLGDLDGNGSVDAVVDYSLAPTAEDNGGGGNAITEIPGLIAFVNTGSKLNLADNNTDFVNKNITGIDDGVIILEGLDYGPDDPRCCPSIKTTTRVVFRNNRLTEIR